MSGMYGNGLQIGILGYMVSKRRVWLKTQQVRRLAMIQMNLFRKRVIRGGSLCNDSYCSGYRPAARMKTSPDTSSNHTGFRLVKNIVVD